MRALLPLAAALFLLIAGCPSKPDQGALAGGFEVRYSSGACHAEWGRTDILIGSDGAGIYEKGSGPLLADGRFSNEEFRKQFELSAGELQELAAGIEKSGFYSLQDYYADTEVRDGSCTSISATRGNSTKTVSVSNTRAPEAYSKAADLVSSLAESKTK